MEEGQTAAAREARGRERLAALDEQLAKARALADGEAAKLTALTETVRTREAQRRAAREALETAEGEVVAARAAAMLDEDPDGARERIAGLERAKTQREQALREAEEAVAAAERALTAEEPLLERKQLAARERVTELERLRKELVAAIAKAHADAGRERLQALTAQHQELLRRRQEAWDAFTAAVGDVRRFYDRVPGQLGEWPDLARLPLESQIGHPLTPLREVIEAFGWYLNVWEAVSGFGTEGLRIPNNAAFYTALTALDEAAIWALMDVQGGGGKVQAKIWQIRATLGRSLERYG